MSLGQLKVMSAIESCRTAALGGHVARCEDCAHTVIAYNSCRNRHCPKCQGAAAKQWLAEREADLLPVPYYHLVFTLPAPIGDIAYQNKAVIYDILFKASAETLSTIAADPKHLGARVGITSVLHTWGSALTHHPHVHMIVPGGGISLDGKRWVSCRPGFFLPVRVLSRLFRRLFLDKLVAAHAAGRLKFFGDMWRSPTRKRSRRIWRRYAKPSGWSMPDHTSSDLILCDSVTYCKYLHFNKKALQITIQDSLGSMVDRCPEWRPNSLPPLRAASSHARSFLSDVRDEYAKLHGQHTEERLNTGPMPVEFARANTANGQRNRGADRQHPGGAQGRGPHPHPEGSASPGRRVVWLVYRADGGEQLAGRCVGRLRRARMLRVLWSSNGRRLVLW